MSLFRSLLARPLSALALGLLLIPAQPAECLGLAAGSHERMPCCSKSADAGTALDGGCCNVREGTPLPEQTPLSTAAARRSGSDVVSPAVPGDCPALASTRLDLTPGRAPDPRSNPLYLRLSSIRC